MKVAALKKTTGIGIKELRDIRDFIDETIRAIRASKENDGKVDWRDSLNFVNVPFKLISAVIGIEQIDEEVADLDATEIAEVESWIDAYADDEYGDVFGHLLMAFTGIRLIAQKRKAA